MFSGSTRGAADSPAVRVHRKHLAPQRIHHHAPCHLGSRSGQRRQKILALRIRHLTERDQRDFPEALRDLGANLSDHFGFSRRQSAGLQRFGNLFCTGGPKISEARKCAPQGCKRLPVFDHICLHAAQNKQQFLKRIFPVVVVKVRVALLQDSGRRLNALRFSASRIVIFRNNRCEQFSRYRPWRQRNLFYECVICGNAVPSLPMKNSSCKCGNISVSVDSTQITFRDQGRVNLFTI